LLPLKKDLKNPLLAEGAVAAAWSFGESSDNGTAPSGESDITSSSYRHILVVKFK
jgi:hypothetical protein